MIEDSYVTGLRETESSHNDGLQATGGSNVTVRHSTFKLGSQNAAVFQMGNESGGNSNWLVEYNLFDGGGWTINGGDQGSNRVFRYNRFTRNHAWGPFGIGNITKTGNYYDDNGAVID